MCTCKKSVWCKLFVAVILLIAVILAIVVSFWKQEGFAIVVNISRFFDVMIPILAVGALIKYLIGCHCCHYHKEGDVCSSSEKTKTVV